MATADCSYENENHHNTREIDPDEVAFIEVTLPLFL